MREREKATTCSVFVAVNTTDGLLVLNVLTSALLTNVSRLLIWLSTLTRYTTVATEFTAIVPPADAFEPEPIRALS